MSRRCRAAVSIVVAILVLTPAFATGQETTETSLRTEWGDPALHGIWDFRSITPLQRPEEYADREFLTEEEAAGLEQATTDRELELLFRPARRTRAGANVDRGEDGALGAYNDFWLDRGNDHRQFATDVADCGSADRTHATPDRGGAAEAGRAGCVPA